MPSAMSSPSEPVETVSISIGRLPLPRRMIEPLPKLRSIWESAASSAFDLSMDEPSTTRNTAWAICCSYRIGIRKRDCGDVGDSWVKELTYTFCSLFAICSFLGGTVQDSTRVGAGPFRSIIRLSVPLRFPQWPHLERRSM